MDARMRASLDNYITGHYGEDQFRNEPEEIEDEGIQFLQSAIKYLKPRADADADDQVTGDYEAYAILQGLITDIQAEYSCHFCGNPINKRKDKYCSKLCYKADHEGY